MAGWCWFPAKQYSAPEGLSRSNRAAVHRRTIPRPIQQGGSLGAGSRPFRAELLNRLDVSKYYVIRTIIISNSDVEGNWVLKFLRGDVRSPAVPQCELPSPE